MKSFKQKAYYIIAALAALVMYLFKRNQGLRSEKEVEKLKNEDVELRVKNEALDAKANNIKTELKSVEKPSDKELSVEEKEKYWNK